MSQGAATLYFFGCLLALGICAVHHFGWEGLGVVAFAWLLAPQILVSRR